MYHYYYPTFSTLFSIRLGVHFSTLFSIFQVAVFGDCNTEVQEIAYQYGRNIGMAFQVDLLLLLEERRVLF